MKKLVAIVVALVVVLSSVSASDWHFWGKDLDQHPEFLWGFFPTYLYGGVGYTGFEFIPGHTTDIQLMAGAGYVQRKLFQNPETGRPFDAEDGGIELPYGPIIYDLVQVDWALKLVQGFWDSPVEPGDDLLSITLAYEGKFEGAMDSMKMGAVRKNWDSLPIKSLDEYVTLFKNYKLKVAEAESMGIDTTAAFKNELAGYREELARPYLIDASVDDRLAQEAYERMKEDVEVSHILVGLNARMPQDRAAAKQKADSILNLIKAGEDFGAMAEKYSEDGSKQNKGYLGFIRGGRTVYPFEKAAFALQPGEVSDVVESQFGYHIIKVHSRRPNPGEYLFSHIMILVPRNASDEVKAQ